MPRRVSKTRSTIEGEKVPRLPHETDESSDSQQTAPRPSMRQAHDDLEHGRVDTDRGEVMDETYRRTRESTPPPHTPARKPR